ncbi:MAG: tetratricopeptide repeat protein [bacterium]
MFGCKKTRKSIQLYLLGEKLTDPELQQMYTHLAVCPKCKKIFEQELELDNTLKQVLAPYRLQKDLTPEVIAHLGVPIAQHKVSVSERIRFPWQVSLRPVLGIAILVFLMVGSVILYNHNYRYSHQLIVKTFRGDGGSYLPEGATEWQPIKVGTRLNAGTALATNKWSQVELRSMSGNEVWVNRDTRIQVTNATSHNVYMAKGELYVNEFNGNNAIRVKTPGGIVDPIGTSFDIQVAENGATIVAVMMGRVQFVNAAGSAVIPALFLSMSEAIQHTPPTSKNISDPESITKWVNEFKEISRRSLRTRAELVHDSMLLGSKYFDAGKYYDSITSYRLVTELQPDRAAAYFGIGRAYYELKQNESALEALETAVNLDPKAAIGRNYLVLTLLRLERYKEALPHAELLVQEVPTEHTYSVILARIYLRLGNLNDAEVWYQYSLTQSPCVECMREAKEGLAIIATRRARAGN